MLMEEAVVIRRQEKVERLRMAWQKRMKQKEYERMVKELSKLTLSEPEGDMMAIGLLVRKLMIGEAGGGTGRYNIIDMADVVMVDTAESNTSNTVIRWTDEQMDTKVLGDDVNNEYVMEDDLEMAHTDTEEVTSMDTLPEVVVMLPEEEEGK